MTLKEKLWDDSSFIKNIYWKIQPAKILYNISPEQAVKILYRLCCGKKIDLNHVNTYNEKIQWLKLYDSTPIKSELSDKYLVKEWVTKKIGDKYVIPTLGVWESFDEIDFNSLPNQFVLKATHGSAMNIIVTDKSRVDYADAKKKFDVWLKRNLGYHTLELNYIPIEPRIIAEQYLENSGGNLFDYKIYCYNGVAKFIHYIGERAHHNTKEAFFDAEWNKLPYTSGTYPSFKNDVPKPNNLNELLQVASSLSKGFPYVRVDFYVLNDGSFKFGEMTFLPGSGYYIWNLPEADLFFGKDIILPDNKGSSE